MSEIIGEFLNAGTVVYWRLAFYEKTRYIAAYVAIDGREKLEVADVYAEYGYEPEYFSGIRELVLYKTYENLSEFKLDLEEITDALKEIDVFIIFKYLAFDYKGFKFKELEWRFRPKQIESVNDIKEKIY